MKRFSGKVRLRRTVLLLLPAALAAGWLMGSLDTRPRARNILLSANGAAPRPETPDQLAPYLDLAEKALSGNATPEERALANELRRRFSESYFNLKTVPGVERLQDNALAAARSGSPEQLGNALLMLVLTRDALASAMAGTDALPAERRAFLRNVALSLGLATGDDLRQLRAFLDWASERDWMPGVHAALLRFERHIADVDPAGGWLPQWVDSIPLLSPAETAPRVLPAAWTWRGHAVAKELAESVDAGWAAAALGEYRKNALDAWRDAAASLWDGMPGGIPDRDIPGFLVRAAEGDDPASRFAARAHEHLSPMFGAGDAPPEILWLRRRVLPGESGAARDARARTAALNAASGASVWPTLSPLAADACVRHLRARQEALDLDAAWLRSVYTPARFNPGDTARLLEQFLTGPADGFWEWSGPGGGVIDNVRREGLPPALSREFLDYCNAALDNARNPALAELSLSFEVASVNITGERVVERPSAVVFRLGPEKTGKAIVYRNYPVAGDWLWTPEAGEAALTLDFPSHSATMAFGAPAELKEFFLFFGEGSHTFAPDDFGPSAPVLRRLGVEGIVVNATLSNLEKLLPQLNRRAPPPLPKSVIARRTARKGK